MSTNPNFDTEAFRDKIATVDQHGKRIWMYPKMPKGYFYNLRSYVSWLLLLVLFGLPFVKIGGEPFVLLNVLERRFVLFGIPFTPQDFHIFVLAMLGLMVFIVLFTVIFGRLFCGWVCPQTIFMEMVFRKIEYWIEGDANAQKRLNKGPWTVDKVLKKSAKLSIFFIISVLIANTFLAYIIGIEEVFRIATEPIQQNLSGFIAMITFSFVFFYVFARLREQVCVSICPYGRLQGVMLDKNSIAVTYDYIRGEPRGKIRKNKKANGALTPKLDPLGDCIDCKLCVHVCPTGIDIRDGIQMECINCTACMDACDEVMEKVGREKGLIRYDSENGIANKNHKLVNPRSIAYSCVLLLIMGVNSYFLLNRTQVETIILRTPGMLYQTVDDVYISNLYNFQIINKTNEDFPVSFKLANENGRLKMIGDEPTAQKAVLTEGAFFIEMEKDKLATRKNKIVIEVYANGELIDEVKTNFLGPIK